MNTICCSNSFGFAEVKTTQQNHTSVSNDHHILHSSTGIEKKGVVTRIFTVSLSPAVLGV